MTQAASVRFFLPTLLSDAAVLLFTVPTDPGTDLFEGGILRFTNTSETARSITVFCVPVGDGPTDTNCIAAGEAVSTASPTNVDLPLMGPGDSIFVLADVTDAVSVSQMSGILITEEVP